MLEYLHWVLLVRLVQLDLVYLEVLEGLVVRLGLLGPLFQVFLEDQFDLFHPLVY